jgi:hypothetical protein
MNTLKFLSQRAGVLLIAIAMTAAISSCKKDEDAHVPPSVEFKTGAGYTSADATVAQGDSVLVGVIATKTEDEMKTFNVSYAYDGNTTTVTAYNLPLSGAQEENFTMDYTIVTRLQPGTEMWWFTITDRDGNITKKSITLTVQ